MVVEYSNENIDTIFNIYKDVKSRVIERLDDFSSIWQRGDDSEIFVELLFCLLTPQSSAHKGAEAIEGLKENNLLFSGTIEDISEIIRIVRFKNNKAKYIVEAQERFYSENPISIRETLIAQGGPFEMRRWLVDNIKGIGYKEASHYLRNIGLGKDLAILDRHILRNMNNLNVIEDVPKTISPKKYLEMEIALKKFSEYINIPMTHLDLLLWYKEAGDIFK